jgi:phage terminase small subunit
MDELKPKQKKFVKEYIKNGGNGTQAVIDAGYKVKDRKVAGVVSAENLAKPSIAKVVKSLSEAFTDKELIKVHKEGLQASKKIFKNNNESGEVELVGDEPDYPTRHKYLETAYKLKGSFAPEKSVNLNINSDSPEQMARLKDIAKKLNELRGIHSRRD